MNNRILIISLLSALCFPQLMWGETQDEQMITPFLFNEIPLDLGEGSCQHTYFLWGDNDQELGGPLKPDQIKLVFLGNYGDDRVGNIKFGNEFRQVKLVGNRTRAKGGISHLIEEYIDESISIEIDTVEIKGNVYKGTLTARVAGKEEVFQIGGSCNVAWPTKWDPHGTLIEGARKAFELQAAYVSDVFVPIGFSKNSRFAFFTGYNCSESGAPFEGDLKIIDLVHDSVIHEKHFQANYSDRAFKSELNRYKVEEQFLQLQHFPFVFNGDVFDVRVDSTTIEVDEDNMHLRKRYLIYLISAQRGPKLIGSPEYDEYYGKPGLASVIGFLKSPFEERIVILTHGNGGSSGGCTRRFVDPFGAHLGVGFMK